MESSPPRRILLWSSPRSLSTAFQFSIMTLPHSKCFFQCYSPPHFIENPFLEFYPFAEGLVRSYDEVGAMLQADYPGMDVVFSKNLAYHVRGKFEMFLEEGFKDFTHTFLIRSPSKAIPSNYRGFSSNLEMWSRYKNNGNHGYYELLDLYNFVKEHLDPSPVVIDADDLLEDSEGMLKAYCDAVGLKYREGMTSWKPGSMWSEDLREQYGQADNEWIRDVLQSSGISKRVARRDPELDTLPKEVVEYVRECDVFYREMYKYRLVLD